MKEYITIKNFGPLKHIEKIELKPFTILIGETASGKSTLMKVVALMRYLFKMANIRSYLKYSKITRSPIRMRFDFMLARMGLLYMLSADTLIEYCVQFDEDEYVIKVSNKKLNILPNIKREHLSLNKVSFISENRNIIPTWVEKASQNVGASLGFYFQETNNDFCQASAVEKTLNLNFLGLKLHISHPKGKNRQYKIEHTNNESSSIKLAEASSGIQFSTPILLIASYLCKEFSFKEAFNRYILNYLHEADEVTKFKPVAEHTELQKVVHIHIEEPELSLFPNAQYKFVKELVETISQTPPDRTASLMLATHSPYILSAINNMMYAYSVGLDPSKSDEVASLISKKYWINPDDVSVFLVCDGGITNIMDEDLKQIQVEKIDTASTIMNEQYDQILNISLNN